MRKPPRSARVAVAAACLAAASAAWAAPRVAVVLPADGQAAEDEVPTRLRAELEAAGFEIALAVEDAPADPAVLRRAANRTDSFAAIAVTADGGQVRADLWIADPVTGRAIVRHLRQDPTARDAPAIFAVRAVELIHASRLELADDRRPQAGPAAGAPVAPDAARRAEGGGRAGSDAAGRMFFAGAAVLAGPGGVPPGVAPAIGGGWVGSMLGGDIRLMGPAISTIRGDEGSATVDQEIVVARVSIGPSSGGLRPFAVGGAGIAHVGARGTARPPYESATGHAWSAAALVGGGARIRAGRVVAIVGEADAVALAPRPAVSFAGQRVATTGRPDFLATAGVEVAW